MNKKQQIDEKGWLLIKNVFRAEEIEKFRTLALQSRDHKGDILSNDILKEILLDKRIVDIVKESLGSEEVVYFGDSSLSVNSKSNGFHKDSRDRELKESKEWSDPNYSLIRMGIYLQDHTEHSGGLCLRENSHLHQSLGKGKIVNVRSEVGDVVVWKLTTTHSGNADVLSFWPNKSLHPRIARRVPKVFTQKVITPRMAIFSAFGKEDEYLDRYMEFLKTRTYAVKRWLASPFNSSQIEAYRQLNVKVITPNQKELEELKASNKTNDLFKQIK